MVYIDGAGGYVPLYRVEREAVAAQRGGSASGESAVPARDENLVTMASEAAGNALARSAASPPDLDAVFTASVTDPFAEHGVAAHVAYRHGATGDVRTGDFRGSGRAATDALVAGMRHVEAMRGVEATGGTALVVGVDALPVEAGHDDEAYSGAGAGAVVLAGDVGGTDADGPSHPLAEIHGVGQATTGFVERHREHGEAAEHGDGRFEGEAGFGGAVPEATRAALGPAPGMPSQVVVQAPDQRMARGAVSEFSGEVDLVSTFDEVGYAGPASFFLDLALLLEGAKSDADSEADPNAGTTGLAVSYGAGGADAVAFSTAAESGGHDADDGATTVEEYLAAKEYVTYAEHLRYRERPDYSGVTAE